MFLTAPCIYKNNHGISNHRARKSLIPAESTSSSWIVFHPISWISSHSLVSPLSLFANSFLLYIPFILGGASHCHLSPWQRLQRAVTGHWEMSQKRQEQRVDRDDESKQKWELTCGYNMRLGGPLCKTWGNDTCRRGAGGPPLVWLTALGTICPTAGFNES